MAERHHAARPDDEVQAGGEQREHQDVGAEHQRVAAGRRAAARERDDHGDRRSTVEPRGVAGRSGGSTCVAAARWIAQRLAEQALGPQHQHDRHDDELGDQRQLGERERCPRTDCPQADAERLDLADQQRREERARDAAHPADDDDDEGIARSRRDRAQSFAGSRGICSAPPRPASNAPSANTPVKSQLWFTPSAPTISRSSVAARISMPQRVRVSSKPERAEHQRPDRDQEQVVLRERAAGDLDRPAQARRARARAGPRRPRRQSAKSLIDQHQREGREELEELRRVVDPPQDGDLDQRADHADHQRRGDHPTPEARRARVEPR